MVYPKPKFFTRISRRMEGEKIRGSGVDMVNWGLILGILLEMSRRQIDKSGVQGRRPGWRYQHGGYQHLNGNI